MEQPEFISLLPIIVTLALALSTRNVVVGLFSGVVCGVAMLEGTLIDKGPLDSMSALMKSYLLPQLTDSYNAGVLLLLVFIGGFVALMEKSGGGVAFAKRITLWVTNKCQAQLATWFGGIAIFFSDLGTPLIAGPVFRPLFDKLKVSRQKLAFIIDSTASPVAILIPFIGWGVYIMSLIQKEFTALEVGMSEWDAFIGAIPYQFYAFLAIAIVPILSFFKLDFGPMAHAERLAKQGSDFGKVQDSLNVFEHKNAKTSFVWAPLLVMLIVLCSILIPHGFPFQQVSGSTFRAALSSAYFFAAMTLIGLMAMYGVRKLSDGIQVYLKGMSNMMSVAVILILAWALSSVGKELGAAAYIAQQAQAGFPYWLVPAVAFLLAGIISFATGSSWGTFAILMPLVIPTAFAIDAPMLVCIGAVLSGGLFGDHCSPISETTILSSTGAGCDQYEHFRTQLPYALVNGGIALISFVVSGVLASPLVVLVAIIVQIAVYLVLSKRQFTSGSLESQPAS
ncbi:Na+/H+ antiporter NhaC family protein [Vibrio breoganii]|uniref:Na+/H+ antiporter NhaC family protein n=1 Tax=Vibrio breoganii TaxID=553239 RepID=UPI0002E9A294|nr:Na+/H+ antiporter NhaC family protein [Vibrio breoganii]OED97066.1 sodium:proton exchanger [Vibrio breoganii ZF-29]PMF81616.1 sodium:proton exchanger [Vibrio breoganii]PML39362.1 sodium:proton exchanger [Vibrio breoganii]PMO71980.1 sodium:proton exchanger [Vibrio breoganii]PMO84305.1 sodium:proton exchanger [Vibrio breoganii]